MSIEAPIWLRLEGGLGCIGVYLDWKNLGREPLEWGPKFWNRLIRVLRTEPTTDLREGSGARAVMTEDFFLLMQIDSPIGLSL